MQFVERLAGQPRRAGVRDGRASKALLDHPRDPELIGDEVWFIDGEDQARLRVLDHGYVRTVSWQGARCPAFRAITAATDAGLLFILCKDQRVIALDLAARTASVVVRPEPEDRFVAIEALPDGSLLLADGEGRIWSSDPRPEARAEPRTLVFDNLGTETLPTGGYPFAFDRVHFRKIVGIEWVEPTGPCWSRTSTRRPPTTVDCSAS
jgi:hypothetical protein